MQPNPYMWKWRQTRTDPIASLIARAIHPSLHARITTRIQVDYTYKPHRLSIQHKRRAYRFIRLSQHATNIWCSIADGSSLERLTTRQDSLLPDPLTIARMVQPINCLLARTSPTPSSSLIDDTNTQNPDSHPTLSPHSPRDIRHTCESAREVANSSIEGDAHYEYHTSSPAGPAPLSPITPSSNCRSPSSPSEKEQLFDQSVQSLFFHQDEPSPKESLFFNAKPAPKERLRTAEEDTVIYVLELYARTSPACRFAHRAPIGKRVRTLAIDWHSEQVESIEVISPSDHHHEQFNLHLLQRRHIDIWAAKFWGISSNRIDWIHSSNECAPQSFAGAAKAIHRWGDANPKSLDAKRSDVVINNTLLLLDDLKSQSMNMLCSVEHPHHSMLGSHPTVKRLLVQGRWNMVVSSHCSTVNTTLDGTISSSDHSPVLFPQKDTMWLLAGVPPYAELPRCHMDCPMLTPEKDGHRLLICMPASHQLKPGQRVMKLSEERGRIPLGAMKLIWDLHLEMIKENDHYDYECVRCGGDVHTDSNPLICCNSCNHIQHLHCSPFDKWEDVPDTFTCSVCLLGNRTAG